MTWDLRRLTNKQLAVLTLVITVASTVVASITALSVALVEGYYDSKVAKEQAQREYRQGVVQPALKQAELNYQELSVLLNQVVFDVAEPETPENVARFLANKSAQYAEFMALYSLNDGVSGAMQQYMLAIRDVSAVMEEMRQLKLAGHSTQASTDKATKASGTLARAMNNLRRATEEYIFAE